MDRAWPPGAASIWSLSTRSLWRAERRGARETRFDQDRRKIHDSPQYSIMSILNYLTIISMLIICLQSRYSNLFKRALKRQQCLTPPWMSGRPEMAR